MSLALIVLYQLKLSVKGFHMVCSICILHYLLMILPDLISGFRLTEPGDIALHKDTVRLVKGTDMRVKCETSRSSKQETLLKWIKINDDAFGTQIVSLNLYGLQKQDSGNYSCFNAEYKRRLSLNVLCKISNIFIVDIVTYCRAKPQQTPSVEKHAHPPRVVYCAI